MQLAQQTNYSSTLAVLPDEAALSSTSGSVSNRSPGRGLSFDTEKTGTPCGACDEM